ncbi:MAG: epoxide hydrolase [Rhodospirillaceae bacterium]|nr:epoxide hydrolase [Rhodospirillaceae bacterium]
MEFNNFPVNDISIRAATMGSGPLVILVHGWPELWYSWRHQIEPIATAGYRVVAPDVRGYGKSDKPKPVEAYAMQPLMDDIVGIIDACGEEKAILVGHDWGAPIVWNTAALHGSRVSAVAGLSVPYRPRPSVPLIELWNKIYDGRFFYQVYFQKEGIAEAELERDIRMSLRKIYFSISGDAPSLDSWLDRPATATLLEGFVDPPVFPGWLTEKDLEYFVEHFTAGGFRGPLNRYRNSEKDFYDLPLMGVARVKQPSCFIAGSKDVVRSFVPGRDGYANLDELCDDMRLSRIIEGVGHWVQQEAPEEVNSTLLKFLSTLA